MEAGPEGEHIQHCGMDCLNSAHYSYFLTPIQDVQAVVAAGCSLEGVLEVEHIRRRHPCRRG